MDRAASAPVLLSNGNVHLSVSNEDSILAAIHSWQRLSKRKKVLRLVS